MATAPSILLALGVLLAQTGGPPEPATPGEQPQEAPAVDLDADQPPPSEWDRQQAEQGGGEEEELEERSFIGQLAQTLIALVVVCGILWLVGKFAISRLSNVRFGGGNGETIQIVEKLQVDPRTTLMVVEVGRERMLLGSGEKGVHLISRLDTTPESVETEPSDGPSFEKVMEEKAGAKKERGPTGPAKDGDDSLN